MKPIQIRTVTIEDYDAMIELWKRANLPFKPKGRESKRMVEKQMEAFPELFIGAFHEGKLVGVVIGSYDGRMKGWINRLAVDLQYRRKGVAQQLVKAVEKVLEERGATIFCALIEAPNNESLGLFRRMGYVSHKEVMYVTRRKSKDD